MGRPRKNTVTKTTNIVVKDEPVREIIDPVVQKKPVIPVAKAKSNYTLSVYTPSGHIDLLFEDKNSSNHAFQQITFKCASNRSATVVSGGKEYTFCKVDYVVRNVED
jgi:hypothetical protein